MDIEAILTHTTIGVPGNPHHKTILYEAKTLSEYKRHLLIFELQQNQIQEPRSRQRNKLRNPGCINCGNTSHQTIDCLHKSEDPKCFTCIQFSHRGMDPTCPKKSNRYTSTLCDVVSDSKIPIQRSMIVEMIVETNVI